MTQIPLANSLTEIDFPLDSLHCYSTLVPF